ncbi:MULTISPECIES: helix-turn-helix domain-containing protein [Rhizobium]|uniref:helix-turn-helix domain-containing protein n=1 Tax=Rhizobium TaxID=379 RepID=UPI001C83237D|nr:MULTISPECIES: helix-turn-helix domain-containing protein [Rhizobium]MBX4895438.1 helix-turn-helix domain-containing protein [Rhizobium bangladeshense]MBX5217860.1 helix-turn-helix domain-containing protein [Rhizobium sp. NLR9a]
MTKAPAKGQKMQALYALHWMPGLAPASRTIGAWLIWHANASSGRCNPGQARLRDETGFSRRTIQTAVQQLVTSGLMTRDLRPNESTSYKINWSKFSHLVADYENLAKTGTVVVTAEVRKEERRKKGGAENCASQARKIAPPQVQEIAPKLSEENSRRELMFRDGVTSERSEADAPISVFHSHGFEVESLIGENKHSDDVVGARILATKGDNGFLAYLDREVRNGRLFSRKIAESIRARLEDIHTQGGGEHQQGDPILGRASRLIETEFERGDAA